MGGGAVDFYVHLVGGGGAGDDVLNALFVVEDEAVAGAQGGIVQVLGAHQGHLLADGEDGLDGRPGQAVVVEGLDDFQDDGYAGLAVGAEDGGAVGGDAVLVHLRADVGRGAHGVHVGGEQEGLGGGGAGEAGHQIAGLAVYLAAGLVYGNLGAHELEQYGEAARYGAFFARERRDLGQVAEQLHHPLLVDRRGHTDII